VRPFPSEPPAHTVTPVAIAVQRTRKRQPPEETRRQILESALEFLRERSFRELNVDVLMAQTGHSRTLFYRHFEDMPALALALIQESGGELMELAQNWGQSEVTSPEEARLRLAAFVDFHTRNAPAVRAIVEASHHDDRIEQAYANMIEAFVAITTQALDDRIVAGDLHPLDTREIARALVRMLSGYLLDPMRTDDPDRALDALWTVWTRTIFPES
jgi:TetR/AcrR family transcriptional regulator, ethionamide resistance regulator